MAKNTCAYKVAIAFVIAPLLFAFAGHAQSSGELKIHLLDSLTGRPVTVASVFFSKTTIGEIDQEIADGTYTLDSIPNGKYDLTIASPGYGLRKIAIEFSGEQRTIDLQLVPESEVNEPTVDPNSRQYNNLSKYFIRRVIGETKNSKKCEIVYLQDVRFHQRNGGKILIASSPKPIIILNEAIGYRILCWLDNAKVDYNPGSDRQMMGITQFTEPIINFGGLLFAEIPPKNHAQAKRWSKERRRAYNGSLTHFMKSLSSETLAKNNFTIRHELDENSKVVTVVVYSAEPQEQVLSGVWRLVGPQTTTISSLKAGIIIYENGYYDNPENYPTFGYMNLTQRMADLMPLNYQP